MERPGSPRHPVTSPNLPRLDRASTEGKMLRFSSHALGATGRTLYILAGC
jgi:hypothetical protein